jgi:hypothetical protein
MPIVYTLVIISCQRFDLLETTLKSFIQHADVFPVETIISEDSPSDKPAFISKMPELGKVTWLNGPRRGMIYAMDRAYQLVKTELVFHGEDDWETLRGPFINPSVEILNKYPKISTVSLRGNDCNGHPIIRDDKYPFPIQQPNWRAEGWGGFNTNPSLRRLSDYKLIGGSYGAIVGYGHNGCTDEAAISRKYLELGFNVGTFGVERLVKHIGNGRSRACERIQYATAEPIKQEKILFAVPACWKFEYGKHPLLVGKLNVHDNAFANRQENPYEAVRETWAKDVKALPGVDFRFFYGRGAKRDPLSDEVFLEVADNYDGLTHKMQGICRWALERGYEWLFKCDSDTFVYVDRLMRTDFRNCDQLGWSPRGDGILSNDNGNYSTGGPGYWLSKRAMEAIVHDTVSHYAEDLWVGSTIRKHGLKRVGDRRFLPGYEEHYAPVHLLPQNHEFVTLHACTPKIIRELYADRIGPSSQEAHEAIRLTEPVNPSKVRVLVGVLSCHQRRNLELRRSQRRTWMQNLPSGMDVLHFVGDGDTSGEAGVVSLHCPDDYNSLIYKTRALIKFALERGYQFLFKTDDDVYLRPDQLMASGFEAYDYSGWARGRMYCQGGSGYWLSSKAMRAVYGDVDSPESYETLWEDDYIGQVLAKSGILPHHDDRYLVGPQGSYTQIRKDFVTLHKLMPKSIDDVHTAWASHTEMAIA